MSDYIIQDTTLQDIADAIRSATNTSNTYYPNEMAAAIQTIEGGYPEPTGTVTISQNGTANVKDYATAAVNVSNTYTIADEGKIVKNGALTPLNLQQKTATQNGTVTPDSGYDGLSSVVVNVPESDVVLPDGYTQKDYVQASGTQYVDTGIKAQGGLYAEIEFGFYEAVSGWHAIISADNSNITSAFKLLHNGMDGGTFQYGTNNYYDYSKSYVINKKYKAYIGNGGLIDYEFFVKWPKASFVSTNNVCLFASATGSTHQTYLIGRIYACKMWLDGTLVRDFIPCVRNSDSTVGFYDLVSESFFGNSGSGSLTSN